MPSARTCPSPSRPSSVDVLPEHGRGLEHFQPGGRGINSTAFPPPPSIRRQLNDDQRQAFDRIVAAVTEGSPSGDLSLPGRLRQSAWQVPDWRLTKGKARQTRRRAMSRLSYAACLPPFAQLAYSRCKMVFWGKG